MYVNTFHEFIHKLLGLQADYLY